MMYTDLNTIFLLVLWCVCSYNYFTNVNCVSVFCCIDCIMACYFVVHTVRYYDCISYKKH